MRIRPSDTPITFRQIATDADNHLKTNLAAAYVQDQIEFSRYVQFVVGLRFDYFDLTFTTIVTARICVASIGWSRREPESCSSRSTPLSFYANYSVSYLPSSGDQFSSLTRHAAG